MLLKRILGGTFLLLLSVYYTCGVEGTVSIEGPDIVIHRPNKGAVELVCNNTEGGTTGWRVNGSNTVNIPDIRNGGLPDHTVNGTNLVIVNATNNTEYVCVSTTNLERIDSAPVTLYIAVAPDIVGDVIIDLDTVSVDNNNVSFTLNWTEPFANFDPIVNYTITINCTDAQWPAVFTVTTTSASVNFITDLSVMTPLSVTASNTVGTSDPTTIDIVAPDEIDMVNIMCGPVDVINQCIVTWNALTADPSVVAAPIYYNVSYSGDNITDSSVSVDVPMATIDLPAVNSDVNVTVTAMNVFGSGPASNVSMDEIMASSLINTNSVFDFDPDDLMNTYSLVVTCEINPTSSAEYCEVIARNDDTTISGSAEITSDMVAVTLSLLECEQTYTIAAGGVDSDTELVGLRIVMETVTASACPVPPTTSSVFSDTTTALTPTATMSPTPNQPNAGDINSKDEK